jgi:hypothetical protein
VIVFDLKCADCASTFEAWFGSSSDFEDQKSRNLLCCPICNGASVSKALMAPNIGAKGNKKAEVPMVAVPSVPPAVAEMKAALAKIAALQAEAIKGSTWVGSNFETQARAMDAGTIETANIYGKATPEQAQAMAEDGIGVMPLLIPIVPPEERN